MNTIIVDYRTSNFEIDILLNNDCNVLKCPKCTNVYESIDGHPDIQIFIENKKLVLQKDISTDFIDKLLDYIPTENIILSTKTLEHNYPKDIFLNAVSLENHFIHNLKFSDEKVLDLVKHKKLISVNQGYTKCSTAVISSNAIITSDLSIYNALSSSDIDALLIPPGDIILPGLNYGFIGGTCGLLSEGSIAFFGNLKFFKHGDEVLKFLIKHDVKPIYLRDDVLIDRGSILKI